MKKFRYISINKAGETKRGQIQCSEIKELVSYLRDKEEYLVKVTVSNNICVSELKKKVTNREVSLFCRELGTMLQAGMPLLDAVKIISVQISKGRMHHCAQFIGAALRKGLALHEALINCPMIFPEFMVNMVKVGEEGGRLDKVFIMLSQHYYKESTLKKKVIGAIAYPLFIFIFTIIAALTLMTTVVPSLMDMIISNGGELPETTKVMISISSFLKANIFYLTAAVIILMCILIYGKRSKKLDVNFIFRKLPIISKVYFQLIAYEFLSAVHMLQSGGYSIVNSMEEASKVIKDRCLNLKLKEAAQCIKNGGDMINTFISLEILDYMSISIIKLGEETGRLDEMLVKLLAIMEEDLSATLNKTSEFIQPAAMLFVGAVVGIIVLSIAMPMFSMYSM